MNILNISNINFTQIRFMQYCAYPTDVLDDF